MTAATIAVHSDPLRDERWTAAVCFRWDLYAHLDMSDARHEILLLDPVSV